MAMELRLYIGLFMVFGYKSLGVIGFDTDQQDIIQTECRDRYLWLSIDQGFAVTELHAVDDHAHHPVNNDDNTAKCGYTLSSNRMNGRLNLKASYFACYTHNQNDKSFQFLFKVTVGDGGLEQRTLWVEKSCSLTLPWAIKEVICEENYMEVTVEKPGSCRGQDDYSKTSRTKDLSTLMLERRDGLGTDTMTTNEAKQQGYTLESTLSRILFRSPYGKQHSFITPVDGVPMEVVNASVVYRHRWAVVMLDLTVACAVNAGTFDDERLYWAVPRVPTPLVPDQGAFASSHLSLGFDSQLLQAQEWKDWGYAMEDTGTTINITVPLGAPGGYKKSFVMHHGYHEVYAIAIYYEHVFLRVYEDGTADTTRHRMVRLLQTPIICQNPFIDDRTVPDERKFTIVVGHFPSDTELVSLKLNGIPLMLEKGFQYGYSLKSVPNKNGTRAYLLMVPFDNPVVHRVYLGDGQLQYSLHINYILRILPQDEEYHYRTSVAAQVPDASPPDILGACKDKSIVFLIGKPNLEQQWEVDVGHSLLTPELARQRGYILTTNPRGVVLEVPLFTDGYTYENITLKDFIGSFTVVVRDAKTLDIHSVATKYCPFQTDELIVCSMDGVMTIATKTTNTWPVMPTSQLSLRDPHCKPQETEGNRVLFSFSLNSCGTKFMVGELYAVYENEIVSHKQYVPKNNPVISRDSKFRLTVQCFYPLIAVRSLFAEGMFHSDEPGFGSVNVKSKPSLKEGDMNEVDCDEDISVKHGGRGDSFLKPPSDLTHAHPKEDIWTLSVLRSADRSSGRTDFEHITLEDLEGLRPALIPDHVSTSKEEASTSGVQTSTAESLYNQSLSAAIASFRRAPWKAITPANYFFKPFESNESRANVSLSTGTRGDEATDISKDLGPHPHITQPNQSADLNDIMSLSSPFLRQPTNFSKPHDTAPPEIKKENTATRLQDPADKLHVHSHLNTDTFTSNSTDFLARQHLKGDTSSQVEATSLSSVHTVKGSRPVLASKRHTQGHSDTDNESLVSPGLLKLGLNDNPHNKELLPNSPHNLELLQDSGNSDNPHNLELLQDSGNSDNPHNLELLQDSDILDNPHNQGLVQDSDSLDKQELVQNFDSSQHNLELEQDSGSSDNPHNQELLQDSDSLDNLHNLELVQPSGSSDNPHNQELLQDSDSLDNTHNQELLQDTGSSTLHDSLKSLGGLKLTDTNSTPNTPRNVQQTPSSQFVKKLTDEIQNVLESFVPVPLAWTKPQASHPYSTLRKGNGTLLMQLPGTHLALRAQEHSRSIAKNLHHVLAKHDEEELSGGAKQFLNHQLLPSSHGITADTVVEKPTTQGDANDNTVSVEAEHIISDTAAQPSKATYKYQGHYGPSVLNVSAKRRQKMIKPNDGWV